MPPPSHLSTRPCRSAFTGRRRRGDRTGWSGRSPSSLRGRAERGPRAARRTHGIAYWFERRPRACGRASRSWPSTSRRRTALPEALALALGAKALVADSRGHFAEALGAPQAGARDRARARPRRGAGGGTSSSRTTASVEIATPTRSATSTSRSPSLAGSVTSERVAVLSERTYALYMLGRWDEALAIGDEFTQERIDAGGVMLSLLQSAVEIHLHRGEVDAARNCLPCSRASEGSTDVQEPPATSGAGCAAQGGRGLAWRARGLATRPSRRRRTLGISDIRGEASDRPWRRDRARAR